MLKLLGSIYKHPNMKHFKFNDDFMNNLDKIKREENAILTGDFNLNLYI